VRRQSPSSGAEGCFLLFAQGHKKLRGATSIGSPMMN
jgi:hypothetical protein